MRINLSLPFCASFKIFFECPPHSRLSKIFTWTLSVLLVYLCLLSIDPSEASLPNCTSFISKDCKGGRLLALFVLYLGAFFGGYFCTLIKLPPILGMVVMGSLLRNIPFINVVTLIDNIWSSSLRKMAFSIILIQVGIDIDFNVFKRFRFIVLRLGIIPCIIECVVAIVVSHFVFSLSWYWSFIFGSVLSAVCPVSIVPAMLKLEKKGLGSDQGLSSLIIAATTVNNIMSLIVFDISLALIFSSNNSVLLHVIRGPIEVLMGISYGVFIGIILWFVPSANDESFMFYRSVIMFLSSFVAIFGCNTYNVHGAGPLAVLILAFVASIRWKQESAWKDKRNSLIVTTETFWWILQPFLFGLLGTKFELRLISSKILGLAIATILIPLVCRFIVSFLILFHTNFNNKERVFVAISMISKATIQAAIVPLVLDLTYNKSSEIFIKDGELVFMIVFSSVILTTPIGLGLIYLTVTQLLQEGTPRNQFERNVDFKIPMLETQGNLDMSNINF